MYKILLTIVVMCSTFTQTPYALGAQLSFDASLTSASVGDVLPVEVLLDTNTETINTVDVSFTIPTSLFDFVRFDDSDSVVSLWITKPSYDKASGMVTLQGLIPGGIKSTDAHLLRFYVTAHEKGQADIAFNPSTILLHDGIGTQASLSTQNMHFSVDFDDKQINESPIFDDEEPEAFTPQIAQDPDVYDGKHFLVFSTKDKGSGVTTFKVKEGFFSKYVIAESPYQLRYQNLDKTIYVKAVDAVGNERSAIIYPHDSSIWHRTSLYSISILLLCISSLLLVWHIRKVRLS